jgi:chemotaxis protein MotB
MNPLDIKSSAQNHFGGLNLPEICEFDPAEEKDSSWLISFVDILSLLITLFVLLLSFSHLTRQETTHPIKVASARAAPAPQPVTITPVPTQQPTAKPAQVLDIPSNIKDMIDVMATAAEVNLVIKDDVLFAEGSSDLSPLGRSVLDGIAQMLNQNDYPISVEGHTDNVPIHTAQFPSNWELSSFRATNVARYFIQRGVATERLRAIGYADTRPIADNDSAAGRARNRRVSLVIHVNEAAKPDPAAPVPAKSH